MSAAERAAAARRQQGLPDRVQDPAVLARVAALLTRPPQEPRNGARDAARDAV